MQSLVDRFCPNVHDAAITAASFDPTSGCIATADASGVSPDDMVYGFAEDLLGLVPEPININDKAGDSDGSALYVVLVQELQRILQAGVRGLRARAPSGLKGAVPACPYSIEYS